MRRELINRVIGALVFVFVLLLFVYLLDRFWFNALVLAILAITYYEWCGLSGLDRPLAKLLAAVIFVGIGAFSYVALSHLAAEDGQTYLWFIRTISAGLSVFWLLATAAIVYLIRARIGISRAYLRELSTLTRSLLLLLGLLLLLPCLWFADFIYSRDEVGRLLLMFFLGICIMLDVMAFFSGKTLGRNRLCPNISANKTVQGLFGGSLAALLWVAAGWFNFFNPLLPSVFMVFMVAVIAAAVVGDLFESLLKRLARIKDSGAIVYGHGGMYDRIDSMVAASPVFVFVLSFFL